MSSEAIGNFDFLSKAENDFPGQAFETDTWTTADSSFNDYDAMSGIVRPGEVSRVLETRLRHKNQAVGLDLAGGRNGHALKDLLNVGILNHGLLTTYLDRRDEATRVRNNLDHISGDLTDPSTWQDIAEWRQQHAPNGFDLIMHRPAGPLQDFRSEVYEGAAHTLLDWVGSRGVLFSQVPFSLLDEEAAPDQSMCKTIEERSDVEQVIKYTFNNYFFCFPGALVLKK